MRSLAPVRRFRIQDTSMQPSLYPGDRVLASAWLRPRPGDIVVVRDPEARQHVVVKRVKECLRNEHGALLVQGDNANVSRDSRHYGAVPNALVIGRVFYRYLPAERRGRL